MTILIADLKVYLAYKTNNKKGKQEDVHGREYKDVYRKFGHEAMVKEYLNKNTWLIK